MTCPGEGILTDLVKRLVDKTVKEVNYFRNFETHVHKFEDDNKLLIRRRDKLQNDIEDAKRNENQIEGEVLDWKEEADNVIQKNAKIRQTRLDSQCPLRKYRQGKRLAQMTIAIQQHIEKCNFERVARLAQLPGIKYYASRDFINFESRKTNLKQLVEALENGEHYMIGLYGMGGTGKTILATKVGKQLEESKTFEKVIFIVVSNPPDVNKIRANIARQIGLDLNQREEVEHPELLWSRICKNESKLLIILDDVWKKLNLRDIGIPFGVDNKNCYVLITTRYLKVCKEMRCHHIVQLHTLSDEDALELFLSHVESDLDDSLARDFVKECGGLPIAIEALASTLRNWPISELNVALTKLRNSMPLIDFDEDMEKVYRCLGLSYENLNDKKAQQLFLLCSIFPEDFEFPIHLIIRLSIGLGSFGKVDDYFTARSQSLVVKNKLIASSLLLKVDEKECVKMHDVVREVAQWIAKEDIQVLMGSRTTLGANKRLVFWRTEDFPDQLDDTKVEVLLLWINGNVLVKDPNAFFAGMSRLSILFLFGENGRKVPSPLLLQSLLSLKHMHTLIVDGWSLGDISILMSLQSLVTLELKNCLIIELPKNIKELKMLRWLGLRMCKIRKNNPFEVIERCSQLEELYFVGNYNVEDWKLEDDKEIEVSLGISPSLETFYISCSDFRKLDVDDNGFFKYFNSANIKHLIPEALFKHIVGKAEVLKLGKIGLTGWKCLVPEIIPVEMDNLTKLYLSEWVNMEYLIDDTRYTSHNIMIFSKLVELHLYDVSVKKLCRGDMPSGFLKKLQILKLEKCMNLENIFLDESLKLPYLRVLGLINCPMFQPSIFQLSVAQSLVRLEELAIENCKELKSLFAYESFEGNQEKLDLLFPELNSLRIIGCGELKNIFGQYGDVDQVLKCKKCMSGLTQVLNEDTTEKYENSKISAISRALRCCFMSLTKDTKVKVSNATAERCTIPLESCPSNESIIETLHHTKECLMRQPLSLENIRTVTLEGFSKVESLFSVSIAKTMIMLETLRINKCEGLKHIIIVTNEKEDNYQLNCTSIFPKLQSLVVYCCDKLGFLFPSTLSGGLQKLKSIRIIQAEELKYIFGKYNDEGCVLNEDENNEPSICLPALEKIYLASVPNIISNGVRKYQLQCPSLQSVEASKEIKSQMQDTTSGGGKECEIQEIVHVETPLTPSVAFQYFLNFHNLKEIGISRIKSLKTLFSISACRNLPQLSTLYINECEELVSVVEDDSNDLHQINFSSIFPKLEVVTILGCNKLEYMFPFSLFRSLQKLKSLTIKNAAELKYIFEKYDYGNHLSNENERDDKRRIHLPALEHLTFANVSKMINNVHGEKYQLSFPHLKRIRLGNIEEFNGGSFLELLACLHLNVEASKDSMKVIKNMQNFTNLEVRDIKIEEVLNFEAVEIKAPMRLTSLEGMRLKNLRELRHICKGPKYILSLPNLSELFVTACQKLKAIFCVSVVRSFPQLSYLIIEDCDELVNIIEESDEDHLHQLCFPKLFQIRIQRCNSLKYISSISTCGVFPKLGVLEITEASEMEEAFILKQEDKQKMATREKVFPKLNGVRLRILPRLVTICEGIDFQTLDFLYVSDCPKYQGSSQFQQGLENGDSENQVAACALPDFAESSKEAMKTSVEEVAASSSKQEKLKEIEAQDRTPSLLGKQVLKGSTSKPQLKSSSLHNDEETEEGGRAVIDPTSKLPARTLSSFKINQSIKQVTESSLQKNYATDDAAQKLKDEQSTCEVASLGQLQDLGETNISAEVSHKTKIPFADDSIVVIVKERVQESPSSNDVMLETMLADLAPSNLSTASVTTPQEDQFPLDVTKKETRSGTIMMANQQVQSEKTYVGVRNIQEDATTMIDKTDTSFIYPQTEDSQAGPSTMSIENIQEETRAMKAKIDVSFFSSQVEVSQSDPSKMIAGMEEIVKQDFQKNDTSNKDEAVIQSTNPKLMKQPISGSLAMPLGKEFSQTTNETRAANVKDFKPSIPMEANKSIHNVISSSHHQIGEIFQLVELKDGEATLLAKALELYPELRLSRTQCPYPIIAFSYRVLVDILVMLATKTPYTITASDRATLEANLSAANFFGFDKDWIELIRAKVFGIDKSDVLVADEKISDMEEELEKCDIALDRMQKKRMEAKEKLEIAQNEFETVDTQLFDLLEHRRKLDMKMAEFRKIIIAKDRPFGI